MNIRKKHPAELARFAIAAFAIAISFAASASADDYWDTSKRVEPTAASSASGEMMGLDARVRGFDGTAGDTTVDKWCWTWDASDEFSVDFDPPGWMIIVK